MGKFTSTNYKTTIDNLVQASKDKFKNPYYIFTDKKPTSVDYYAQNKELSTLDEATKTYYDTDGFNSPIKYNFIHNFYIYGLDKINPIYNTGDFGFEAEGIEGEGIILPNTITPINGDIFTITYTKEKLAFRINQVNIDTLDTGANIYKINYSLYKTDISALDSNIAKEYKFIITNVGTDYKTIILSTDYDLIKTLEDLNSSLIKYYNELFFDTKVQALVFDYNGFLIYDPYLIEFIKRNKVFDGGDKYIYVDHQTQVNKTFSLNYSNTIFNNIENAEKINLNKHLLAVAKKITDINSLFITRLNSYYELEYNDNTALSMITRIPVFDPLIIDRIINNVYIDESDDTAIYNIWTAYFNDNTSYITGNILNLIKNFQYQENKDCFYCMPITIYIISKYIKSLLS